MFWSALSASPLTDSYRLAARPCSRSIPGMLVILPSYPVRGRTWSGRLAVAGSLRRWVQTQGTGHVFDMMR